MRISTAEDVLPVHSSVARGRPFLAIPSTKSIVDGANLSESVEKARGVLNEFVAKIVAKGRYMW